MNARSLRNKLADIFDFVCECKLNLLAITETWLNANDDAVRNQLCPINYKLYDQPRTDRTGGGTALLYHDSLHMKKIGAGEKESVLSFLNGLWSTQPTRTRPPYSDVHRVPISIFQFSELADYL